MPSFAVRLECRIVDHDLWRQWQAFGFAPFIDAAERFTAAARTFLDGADNASARAADDAARTFSDFLREQFAHFHMPWNAGLGAADPQSAPMANSPAFGPTREHQPRAEAGRAKRARRKAKP
jgi:hypothetical protein